MHKRFSIFKLLPILCAVMMMGFATPAYADWPSWKDVLKKIAPIMGMSGDQTEATIFSIDHPSCAGTIVSYTVAEDYSLVGFIGTLKVANLQSLPQIIPINAGNCHQMQPVRMAYEFIDRKGDEYLGKSKADFFRKLLAAQISEGKAAVDDEISSIPYVGTIITNWDCECDAAFETSFAAEKIADQIVGLAIKIVQDVKDGNYGQALEKMIVQFGPDVACKIGEDYSGVSNIPVVSTVADEACSKIAGKVVGWVVSGAGTLAEFAGLIGGDHIGFDDYYHQVFEPELGKDGYLDLANTLYKKCYDYFEPTNLSASNSKKVCTILRDRYVEQSTGKLQWAAFQDERYTYYHNNVEPQAKGAAFVTDADFKAVKEKVRTTCKAYFLGKYPKAAVYTAAYNSEPIETICDDFVTYSPSTYHPWDMDKARAEVQKNLTYQMAGKTSFGCNVKERNLVSCVDGPAMNACQQEFTKACVKSTTELGGQEMPCCMGGGKVDNVNQSAIDAAAKIAKDSGGPFCTTSPNDPKKIVCTLKQAFEACQKHFSWENERTCDPKDVSGIGQALNVCCSFDPSGLEKVAGVTDVKSFVNSHNADSSTGCSAGGATLIGTLSFDPRVAVCGSDANQTACQAAFGKDVCAKSDGGYVGKPCCAGGVFGGNGVDVYADYDPASRKPEELAAAKKIVDDSHGACHFRTLPDGKIDALAVVCTTPASVKQCVKIVGKGTDSRSKCTITKSGYVFSTCCQVDPAMYQQSLDKVKLEQDKALAKTIIGKEGNNGKNLSTLNSSKAPANDSYGDLKKPKDKGSPKAGDMKDAVGNVNATDLGDDAKHAGDKLKGAGKPRAGSHGGPVSDKANELVSIQLMKIKPLSGISPFTVGDVRGKIDPASNGGSPSAADITKQKGKAGERPPGPPVIPETPAANDNAPATNGIVNGITNGLRSTFGGAAAPAAAGFCADKTDGLYCNGDVLTTCYHNAAMNTKNCPGGCDPVAKACNPYKE